MRAVLVVLVLLMQGCGGSAPSAQKPEAKQDPMSDPAYRETVANLEGLNEKIGSLLEKRRNLDGAAELLKEAKPLTDRLLAASPAPLPAMKAVADTDTYTARLYAINKNYGWARMFYQKNFARWKNWPDQTAEVQNLRKLAELSIADCDRQMAQ